MLVISLPLVALLLTGCNAQDGSLHKRFWEHYQYKGDKALLQQQGEAAQAFFQKAIAEAGKLGKSDTRLASSYVRLGEAYELLGKKRQARQSYEQSLVIFGAVKNAHANSKRQESADTAEVLMKLAALESSHSHFGQARNLYAKAIYSLEARWNGLREKWTDKLLAEDLIHCYLQTAKLEERSDPQSADSLYRQALDVCIKARKPWKERATIVQLQTRFARSAAAGGLVTPLSNSPAYSIGQTKEHKSWSNLIARARAARKEGNSKQALADLQQALAIANRDGMSTLLIASTEVEIAGVYMGQREWGMALPILEKALSHAESTSPDYETLDPLLTDLYGVALACKRSDLAIKYMDRQVQSREKYYITNDVRVADSLLALGQCLVTAREHARATAALERSVAIYSKAGPSSERPLFRALDLIGKLYKSDGQHKKATVTFERVLQLADRLGESERADHAARELSRLYSTTRDSEAAQRALAALLAQRERAQGNNSRALLPVLEELMHFYIRNGQIDESSKCHDRAIAILDRHALTDKSQHAHFHRKLANAYRHDGQLHRAEELYKKAMQIERSQGTAEDSAGTLKNYADLLWLQGQTTRAEEHYIKALKLLESDPRHPERRIQKIEKRLKRLRAGKPPPEPHALD